MTLAAKRDDAVPGRLHQPVMVAEVRALVLVCAPRLVVDATVGTGGHAHALLKSSGAGLLGCDRDAGALAVAAQRLREFGSRAVLRQAEFAELKDVAREAGFAQADAILADLGMSSFALDDAARGFSLRLDGPLDMRMDLRQKLRAYDIVNEENEAALARLIHDYGEERGARRIARAIVEARRRHPLETTSELRAVVERALGPRRRSGIHPATRTFQALRIAVNHELESLGALLADAPLLLAPGGRMITIAYHSLEDRAVKERFRSLVSAGGFTAVTAKVLRPKAAEVAANPRARSARLRCVQRAGR